MTPHSEKMDWESYIAGSTNRRHGSTSSSGQMTRLGSLIRRRSAQQSVRTECCELSYLSRHWCDRVGSSAASGYKGGELPADNAGRAGSAASAAFIPFCIQCKGHHDLCFVCEEGNAYMMASDADGARGSLGQLLRSTLERLGSSGRSRKASERSECSSCAVSGGALSATFPFELDVVDIDVQ